MRSRMPDWLVVVILVEFSCLLVGLLMPVTPSRLGGKWSPAGLLGLESTYVGDAVAWFVLGNILVMILGLFFWVVLRLQSAKK